MRWMPYILMVLLLVCRWVFTVKLSPNGSVDRLKNRLIAKGYTQIYDLNYDDTFTSD